MMKIVETELDDVFEIKGDFDSELFHICVDGTEDEEMEDKDGNPMVWHNMGENPFEKALLGYATCYDKLTDDILAEIVLKKNYSKAVAMLKIDNIVSYITVPSMGLRETILLLDYCYCSSDDYLNRFKSNLAYVAKNENSKLCKAC